MPPAQPRVALVQASKQQPHRGLEVLPAGAFFTQAAACILPSGRGAASEGAPRACGVEADGVDAAPVPLQPPLQLHAAQQAGIARRLRAQAGQEEARGADGQGVTCGSSRGCIWGSMRD